MKHRLIRCLCASAVLGATIAVGAPTSGAADKVTFTVGGTQDVDSLNVTVGYLVLDYEIWNLTLPTLTDKAAEDFAVAPGLAESWTGSADGLTWTYTLREGLKWSDGEPLTADDVVYTLTRSVEEEWINHFAVTANLTATAPDDRTVVVTTSVPDPKLPTLDFYVVPKHIYEKISADDLPNYVADDNVSGGAFRIIERKGGEFVRLERNPNWYGDEPEIEELVFRVFANGEAELTALTSGDIDAIDEVPEAIYADIVDGDVPNIAAIGGAQGSFSQIAINTGCESGIGDGHPALKDKRVRQAINWAIDRDLLVEKVLRGFGEPAYAIIVSPLTRFDLRIPDDTPVYSYDPEKAKALLDEAGWVDDDGDGVRAKDGVDLRLRYNDRSDGNGTQTTGFITGWLSDVGIATDVETVSNDTLITIQGKSEFDLYTWGWTPFVDPETMLSYFTSANVPTDPDVGGYNDGNWCNAEYDALYEQQRVELDPAKREGLIQQMLQIFYEDAPYAVMYKYDELQAIRSDRWENFVRQPADGPVLFTNTSPAYLYMRPTAGGGSDDDSNTGLVIGVAAAVVVIGGAGIFAVVRGRKKSDEDRE